MSRKWITVYHGSPYIIEAPVWGYGSRHNDYGRGFYTTESKEMACEWACARGEHGYANEYQFDLNDLDVMYLTGRDYHILNWLAVLLDNRTFRVSSDLAREGRDFILSRFLPDYRDRDVIVGYRADDSYFSFSNAFLNNGISLEQLSEAMRLGKLGEQVTVKSRKAFEHLQFIEAHPANKDVFYPLAKSRDVKAREDFAKMKAGPGLGRIYLIDIMRQQWDYDEPALQAFKMENES